VVLREPNRAIGCGQDGARIADIRRVDPTVPHADKREGGTVIEAVDGALRRDEGLHGGDGVLDGDERAHGRARRFRVVVSRRRKVLVLQQSGHEVARADIGSSTSAMGGEQSVAPHQMGQSMGLRQGAHSPIAVLAVLEPRRREGSFFYSDSRKNMMTGPVVVVAARMEDGRRDEEGSKEKRNG